MKKLVIVESPSKIKTITKYLGSAYEVVSSMGHVRDLATTGKYGLGVDIENDFLPNYVPIKGKKKIIADLKKKVSNSSKVYLATDPDREGEAISWHLFDVFNLSENDYERVVFNEITKDVILNAFSNPRKIDMSLVKSQETRRILDRIIGFRLSSLMKSKTGGKSAGRVQSVALKLIVDREREIDNFKEEEYWTIEANFIDYKASLDSFHGTEVVIRNEVEANDILKQLSKSFTIENVNKNRKEKSSKLPFKTSTLQQMASSKLGFNPSKTMRIAQKLYEGVDLADESVGLITYMRTDSTRLSATFIKETFDYIKGSYGTNYVGYVKKQKKDDNMQDAHEGIRPTSILRVPNEVKPYLTPDEFKLYKLIYIRSLASLMANAKMDSTVVDLDNNGYLFKINGSVLTFDGYLKVYSEYEQNEDVILPDFANYKSNVLVSEEITPFQHFTKPPARYSEATLIKEMEKLGIGRPSTYAKTAEILKERSYVILIDKKFHPTEVGIETTDKLQEYFSNIINVKYTALMETHLDKVAEAKYDSIKVLKDFYNDFAPLVDEANEKMEKKEPQKTGELCPECGSDLVIKRGRYGEFTACSNYPTCKFIKKEKKEIVEVIDCPNCDGKILERKTRKGKIFYGCSNYPKCKTAYWDKPIAEKCPECGNILTEKKDNIRCSSCEYTKPIA